MTQIESKSHQALKNILLHSAISVVEKEGFAGLNVRKLASMAGCAIGMVYKIFENMDDLAIHVNAATLELIDSRMAQPMAATDPKEAIHELAERYIDFSRRNFHLWSMLFEHRMERDLPEWFHASIARNFRHVEQALAPWTHGDPQAAALHAKVVWAALHGICSLSISGKLDTVGAQSASILARHMLENYMAGLEANSEGGRSPGAGGNSTLQKG